MHETRSVETNYTKKFVERMKAMQGKMTLGLVILAIVLMVAWLMYHWLI
ncbi:hypothetical protein [Alkalibacillus salilacus]|uniref:Uncharacterized protein n=1 Tax=Alkalibacillus salilacus TaxID=284582 RepID=A0ABT9VH42_9BACI|nr:hypothetical protein [Alkalibacillus salilacus]MDQ0160271.1 hypothetical protein [Alkalibacillus salilacus]